jgi:hypothetical protein
MTPTSDAARLAARDRLVLARGALRNAHERFEVIRTVYDKSAPSARRQIMRDWQAATAEYGNAISDYVKTLAAAVNRPSGERVAMRLVWQSPKLETL